MPLNQTCSEGVLATQRAYLTAMVNVSLMELGL